MRLFSLELKRIIKTRLVIILMLAAIVLSVLCAWFPVIFVEAVTLDGNNHEVKLTGLDAIRFYQENDYRQGIVTAEKVQDAMKHRQEILREYNSEYGENIPDVVYTRELWPNVRITKGAMEVMADRSNGIVPKVLDIDTSVLSDYYGLMEGRLRSILRMEDPRYPSAEEKAVEKFSAVSKPYTYFFGVDSNNMDYETILIFLLCVICAFICSTLFSSDAQTKAEEIHLCSKNGALNLAVTRIGVSMTICAALFVICVSIFILITQSFFGKTGNLTSVQVLYSVTSLIPWNMGQLQWNLMWYSLLFMECTILFSLLISTLCRNNTTAVGSSLLSVVLPIIVYVAAPEKIGNWIQCILPSGGIGTSNSVLYMLRDYTFLHIGKLSFWSVDVLLFITALEIPLIMLTTMFFYRRKTS